MTIDEEIVSLRKSASKSLYYEWQREQYQIAEWLEELKTYRECNVCEYNKALDDFVRFASDMPIVEEEDGEYRPMRLEEIAEQLKAGVNNEP